MRSRSRSRWVGAVTCVAVVAAACTAGSEVPERLPGPAREPAGRSLRFVDVAGEVGLGWRQGAFRWDVTADPIATMGTGLCWLDADTDGDLDLFVVNSWAAAEADEWIDAGGLPRSTLFRNDGARFADVGAQVGADLEVRGTGCVAADLDLDGATDLYVTSGDRGTLLWNDGAGRFVDGTTDASIEAFGWHTGAAVGDVNGDGWPDLFVAGYVDVNRRIPEATRGFPNTYEGVRDLLYLNEGVGNDGRATFREVGAQAGLEIVDPEYGLGALFSDLDRDGDLDLYVANDTQPNRLYENVAWPGGAAADPLGLGFRFEEMAGRAGVADPNAGMGVAAGDYDGDGRTDLFVTNARGQVHGVFRGAALAEPPGDGGDPVFEDARVGFGPGLDGSTGWGVTWADLDLDTDLDLAYVNGEVLVRDLEADAEPVRVLGNLTADGVAGRFEDLGAAAGLEEVGPLLARGSAAADHDGDGDLDLAIVTVGGPLVLLENRGTTGHWLAIELARFDPGARVTVELPDGRRLHREAVTGSSYLSSEDPRIHVGLGDARAATRVTVRWTDGTTTSLEDIEADRVVVVEASG